MPQLPVEFQDDRILFAESMTRIRNMLEATLGYKATAAGQILVSTGPGNMAGDNTELLQIPQTGQGILRINPDRTITLQDFSFINGVLSTDTRLLPEDKTPVKSWAKASNTGGIPVSELPDLNIEPVQIGRTYQNSGALSQDFWHGTGIVLPSSISRLLIIKLDFDRTGAQVGNRYTSPDFIFTSDLESTTTVASGQRTSKSNVYVIERVGLTNVAVYAFRFALSSRRELMFGSSTAIASGDRLRISLYEVADQDAGQYAPFGTYQEILSGSVAEVRQWTPAVLHNALIRSVTDQTARDAAEAAVQAAMRVQSSIDANARLIAAIQAGNIDESNIASFIDGFAITSTPTITIPADRFGNNTISENKLSTEVRRKLNERGAGSSTPVDPYVLPQATPTELGGVREVTAALIDEGTSGVPFGWAIAHVRRLIERIVPLWARAENPPKGTPDVPVNGRNYTLRGRNPTDSPELTYWDEPNYVPNTPGTSSGVGHVLTVTGENDKDYAFRPVPAVDAAQIEQEVIDYFTANPPSSVTDATARAAAAAAASAAAAAQLDIDTVIEVWPPFIHNETGPKTIGINIRHPLNAYRTANTMSVAIAGQPAVLVEYDNTVFSQDTLAEISTTSLRNIWAVRHSIPDGQGGMNSVQTYNVGSYIPVAVQLQVGRNGNVVFRRVLDIPVVEAPSEDVDAVARQAASQAASAAQTAANAAQTAVSDAAAAQRTANAAWSPTQYFSGTVSVVSPSTWVALPGTSTSRLSDYFMVSTDETGGGSFVIVSKAALLAKPAVTGTSASRLFGVSIPRIEDGDEYTIGYLGRRRSDNSILFASRSAGDDPAPLTIINL